MQVKKCLLHSLKLSKTRLKAFFLLKNLHFYFFLVLIVKDCLHTETIFFNIRRYGQGGDISKGRN